MARKRMPKDDLLIDVCVLGLIDIVHRMRTVQPFHSPTSVRCRISISAHALEVECRTLWVRYTNGFDLQNNSLPKYTVGNFFQAIRGQ